MIFLDSLRRWRFTLELREVKMEAVLICRLEKLGASYVQINTKHELTKIYNLYVGDVTNVEPVTDIELLYFGLWYAKKGDEENMKKYYLMAIDMGSSSAMYNMGHWYKTKGDEENMKKYYLMAIDLGSSSAMNNLGNWYKTKGDEENMKKYYLMAIDLGNQGAMNNLGHWYKTKGDEDNMKKYYLMSIDLGESISMNNLGCWYETKGDEENMKKYYLMAIDLGNQGAMNNLGHWYQPKGDEENMKKYFIMAVEHGSSEALNYLGLWYYQRKEYKNIIELSDVYQGVQKVQDENVAKFGMTLQKSIDKILSGSTIIPPETIKILIDLDMNKFKVEHVGLSLIQKIYRKKIDMIELHFDYAPNGKGMNEAKEDFLQHLIE